MARSSDVEYKMRMTQDLKDKIVESAKEHNRSMNADIVARLEDSFLLKESSAPTNADVKVFHLKNGKRRVVFGKLLNNLSLDYTQDLDQLRDDIHLALEVLSGSSFWNSLKFLGKDVLVYKGDSHIKVVDNGKKSLGWLTVEDHITDEYMEKMHGQKNGNLFMKLEQEYDLFINSEECNQQNLDSKSNVNYFLRKLALDNYISSNSKLIDQNWWRDRKVLILNDVGGETYEFTPQESNAKFSNKESFLEWVAYNLEEVNKVINS